ncbi:hypothetical protein NQ317_014545 [Molorchus minor]|uniref:Uncharacterized protein n=1 Tax=Molorchus minor TaxID=1323400 RepID=A0ABQ9JLQ9_9CUCU|nr:hypothetical protein NQ317_014545 [Molorchus minor]
MPETQVGYIGHLQEFDPANSDWSVFKRRIDNYFVANNITDDKRKGAILLNVLNEEAYKLLYNLCLPEDPERKKYSELIPLLSEYFKPSLTVFAARYQFYTSRKTPSETAKEWSARVRQLAGLCQFEDQELNMVLRDHFIIGFCEGRVQDRLFEEKKSITLKEAVEIAISKSAAHPSLFNSSTSEMKKEPEIHYAQARNKHFNVGNYDGPTTSNVENEIVDLTVSPDTDSSVINTANIAEENSATQRPRRIIKPVSRLVYAIQSIRHHNCYYLFRLCVSTKCLTYVGFMSNVRIVSRNSSIIKEERPLEQQSYVKLPNTYLVAACQL